MGATTKIEWCDKTFNPFRGCVEVSEGCDHCYAREQAKRNPQVLGEWGADKARVLASDSRWREPLRWNTLSFQHIQEGGRPHRVFCASIADVFENNRVQMVDSQGRPLWHNRPVPYLLDNARTRLWTLIENTPHLRWLLLTKRPQNIRRMLPADADEGSRWRDMESHDHPHNFRHVWFGTTVENQRRADERIPQLMDVPCRLRFLSCEPLLGPINLEPWLGEGLGNMRQGIGWVIVGGESGGGARRVQLDWIEEIVGQCKQAKVPVFVKQLGKEPYSDLVKLELIDRKKGGDITEFPDQLRVREFPDA